ncbi:hypothetical protein PVAND_001380 [Polypedilum vanderplanki]|uniref:Uncharacterized protein n=1 Tax=Polypedilum vanderplanki TaxID=319348 RepID=A0A9J6BN78_POLVA|nr:hypothetical protein PVAND_001380 [Polypedilum vanderplanki]
MIKNVEISEVFDKLHVNENDSAIEVTDTIDSSSSCNSNSGNESPQSPLPTSKVVVCEKPERSSPHNDIDDWNSLVQFENFIKLEMENLETATAAAKNNQQKINTTTTTVPTTAVKSNILKLEKHVSDNASLLFLLIYIIQLNYAERSVSFSSLLARN